MKKKYESPVFEVITKEQVKEIQIENENKNEIAEEFNNFFSDAEEKMNYKCETRINDLR